MLTTSCIEAVSRRGRKVTSRSPRSHYFLQRPALYRHVITMIVAVEDYQARVQVVSVSVSDPILGVASRTDALQIRSLAAVPQERHRRVGRFGGNSQPQPLHSCHFLPVHSILNAC